MEAPFCNLLCKIGGVKSLFDLVTIKTSSSIKIFESGAEAEAMRYVLRGKHTVSTVMWKCETVWRSTGTEQANGIDSKMNSDSVIIHFFKL